MSAKHFGPHENGRFTLEELERLPGFKRSGDTIRCVCPIHGGDNPQAFIVELATGRGHCFTQGCWGYLDDGRERGDRTRRGPTFTVPPPPQEPPIDPARTLLLRGLWPKLTAAFPGSPAEAYLLARDIPQAVARSARIGYDPEGALWERMRGRVVFPLAMPEGQPINVAARRLTLPGEETKEGRWLFLRGRRGYFHAAGLRQAHAEDRTLYVCEGVIDALALLAGGLTTAVAICGSSGVVQREHLRGLWRVVLCLDADNAGQSSGPEIGRMARTAGCTVEQLRAEDLAGAKDVAEYWQRHHALPGVLRDWAAQDTTALDADLIADMAMRNNAVTIAERLAALRARWDGGEQTPQVRGVLADWQAIAARRATIDAERARVPRDADTGPDDGDTGEAWVEEG